MTHPLVTQLRFTRKEFIRCLEGVSPKEAIHRFKPMNCISWIVGHLANQENLYWVLFAQDKVIFPHLQELVGWGHPPSTPPFEEMWESWHTITGAADEFLDTLSSETLQTYLKWKGKSRPESVGTMLFRNIYHYWFHLGEAHAIRQLLGHKDLPQFIGDMSDTSYQPEL